MRVQCVPVCTCTKKTHSSAGLCWLTLVHIGSHGPQCNQWRLHLHQLWPFPYFPFKLSNSLMPPAFHRNFSSQDMIRTSELNICGHCLHCIKDATIYCNHVLFLVISILKVSMNLFVILLYVKNLSSSFVCLLYDLNLILHAASSISTWTSVRGVHCLSCSL